MKLWLPVAQVLLWDRAQAREAGDAVEATRVVARHVGHGSAVDLWNALCRQP
ncbi:hypothetical protein [Pseudomonas sp.]|uniref:hypothetical protein n=1 Tax=Pseudomonas sp. TaxID=306 RepID=UPI002589ED3D|nr:hypothetical protein [Pseudomonas sp.]